MVFEAWTTRVEELETQIYGLYLASRDPRTPIIAKGLIIMLVAYAVSPIDPIPDFIPLLGYLDELIVLPIGIALVLRLVPDHVMAESREQATNDLDVGMARWIVAGIVLMGWAVIGLIVLQIFTDWV